VNLPEATYIGATAFQQNPIATLYAPKAETVGQLAFPGLLQSELSLPSAETIGARAFGYLVADVQWGEDKTPLTKLSLPEATEVGHLDSKDLAEAYMPKAEILRGTFNGDEALESVSLPAAKEIYTYTFAYTTKLASLDLPNVTLLDNATDDTATVVRPPTIFGGSAITTLKLTSADAITATAAAFTSFDTTKVDLVLDPNKAAEVSGDANNIWRGVTWKSITLVGAPELELEEESPIAFNKNPAHEDNKDITATLRANGRTLAAVKLDGSPLTLGAGYTVEGEVYTFPKTILANMLTAGTHTVTFAFEGAVDDLTFAIVASGEDPTSALAALEAAIEAADAARAGSVASGDGSELDLDVIWATQGAIDDFDAAIEAAQDAADGDMLDMTIEGLQDATTALQDAQEAFEGALKPGTKTGAGEDTSAALAALNAAVASAEAAKAGVYMSLDGADVADTAKWVTLADLAALNAALSQASAAAANPLASISLLDRAKESLGEAADAFEAAKQDGTKAPPPSDTGNGYAGGPSTTPVEFNEDSSLSLDKTNEKVYTSKFTVAGYAGEGEVSLITGGTQTIHLAPSALQFTVPTSCGCFGAIKDPAGPVPCLVEAPGCGGANYLGFCGCAGPTHPEPVTLQLEAIKGDPVGASDSSIATAIFNPATGDLTITGVKPGTTAVSIEAVLHNTAVDAIATAAPYVAYRYSVPLVLTIKVADEDTAGALAALNTAAADAVAAKAGVYVSASGGDDVDSAAYWVTQNALDALNGKIAEAQALAANPAASNAQLEAAAAALETAAAAFAGAKQAGTRGDADAAALAAAKAVLGDAISAAEAARTAAVSTDGSDIGSDRQWVPASADTAYAAAIEAAKTAYADPAATVDSIGAAALALGTAGQHYAAAQNPGKNTANDPTAAAKWTEARPFAVSTNHGGAVDASTQTDDQYIVLDIPFDKAVTLDSQDALIASLTMKLYNSEGNLTANKTAEVLADGKTLRLTLHIAFAPFSGLLQVTAKAQDGTAAGIATAANGLPAIFPAIGIYVPNGVTLEGAAYERGTAGAPASVAKTVALDSATRGMVHFKFTVNGQPVPALNTYGGNFVGHFHYYLTETPESFAEYLAGVFNGDGGNDYGTGTSQTSPVAPGYTAKAVGARLVITADGASAGEILDLQVIAEGVANEAPNAGNTTDAKAGGTGDTGTGDGTTVIGDGNTVIGGDDNSTANNDSSTHTDNSVTDNSTASIIDNSVDNSTTYNGDNTTTSNTTSNTTTNNNTTTTTTMQAAPVYPMSALDIVAIMGEAFKALNETEAQEGALTQDDVDGIVSAAVEEALAQERENQKAITDALTPLAADAGKAVPVGEAAAADNAAPQSYPIWAVLFALAIGLMAAFGVTFAFLAKQGVLSIGGKR
jgi:hypothetical protein